MSHHQDLISRNFNQAAPLYDQYAHIQQHVGTRALAWCPAQIMGLSVDLGCGTGYFLPELAKRSQKVIAMDIAPHMLKKASQYQKSGNIYPVCANAHALPFRSQSVAHVFSNFVLQWCSLPQALLEIHRILLPSGQIVFSLPLQGSLQEIADAFHQVDQHTHVNSFYHAQQIIHLLKISGFKCIDTQAYRIQQSFKNVRSLFNSIKAVGANALEIKRRPGLMGKEKFSKLSQALTLQAYHQKHYRLTYHIGIFSAYVRT